MNLTIDHLNLQLPPGFEHRADAIARGLGDALARLPWTGDHAIAQLQLSPQQVHPAHSDGQIAAQLARAIHSQITRGKG